jgi:cell division septation protein DedD
MFTPESAMPADAAEVPETPSTEAAEFEIVMGRRQIASATFLVLTVIASCAGGAYWVGKANHVVAAAPPPIVVQSAPPPAALPPAPMAVNGVSSAILNAPLYGTPLKGPLYIQLGAVERGFAILMVQGSRKLGYPAFVGPSVSDHVFRVVVGPFKNEEEFNKAKAEFDQMGLETFARKYQE